MSGRLSGWSGLTWLLVAACSDVHVVSLGERAMASSDSEPPDAASNSRLPVTTNTSVSGAAGRAALAGAATSGTGADEDAGMSTTQASGSDAGARTSDTSALVDASSLDTARRDNDDDDDDDGDEADDNSPVRLDAGAHADD